MRYVFLFSLSALGTSAYSQNISDFENHFSWLTGNWVTVIDAGYYLESWTQFNDSTFSAVSYFVDDTTQISKENNLVSEIQFFGIVTEKIQLRLRNSVIEYVPLVTGENEEKEVIFTMHEHTASTFVFENMNHDFPQKIVYSKLDSDHATAVVSGVTVEGKQEYIYQFRKIYEE